MEPVLDHNNPLASVLQPGERLIWIGKPKRRDWARPKTLHLVTIAAALGWILERLTSYCLGPFPASVEIVIIAAGGALALMVPFWFVGHQIRATAYAVTSQRLLMALGPNRRQIREITLGTLGSVRVHRVRWFGKVLDFAKRGDGTRAGSGARPTVWTLLENGTPDKRYAPWSVDDAESVRRLIETASDQYWFGSPEN